jgi:hypothetical protein
MPAVGNAIRHLSQQNDSSGDFSPSQDWLSSTYRPNIAA